MAPRQPPDKPDDGKPSKLKQIVANAPDTVTPANKHPVPKTERDAPRLVQADDVDVEVDRIEAYLKGPTAFTA